MSNAALKISILAFLAAYAVGGLATEILLPGREKSPIPLFSWFLFDTVPNRMRAYAVEITADGERVFDPPLAFRDADSIVANPSSPKGREFIQRIGKRLAAGDAEAADAFRRRFERAFLPPAIRYRIVQLDYDPIDRWRNGTVNAVPIRTFVSGEFQ